MPGATRISAQETTPYACGADFCRIFAKDMDSLYRLAFLLTAEHSLAEKCFVRGLEDSQRGNPVFKEWTQSWARRTIIKSAIQMIRPRPAHNRTSSSTSDRSASHAMTPPAGIANIVGLPQFERFAFAMSVLEGYSYQECSLLLDCTPGDVTAARTWVLEQIARAAAEPPCKVVRIDSDEQALPGSPGSLLQPEAVPGGNRRA
jgi:DNA-directed RNA polymerase specialized sigma24 family protein